MTATLVAFMALMFVSPLQRAAPPRSYSVSGRVVDATTGKPMIGAVAILWERSGARSDGRRATVGASGTFEFSNVPAGSYVIAPTMPGLTVPYRTETIDLDIRDSDVTGLGLIITPLGPRPLTVAGILVMDGGAPLPASITRIRTDSEASTVQKDGRFQLQFRTGEKYRFRLEDLPDGFYIKSFSAGSWIAELEALVFTGAPPANFQVTLAVGTGAIRGRVLDRTGVPAGPQASLTLSGPTMSTSVRDVVLNADGTFQVDRLRPGNYTLKARQGAGAAMQSVSVALTLDTRERSGLDLVLKSMTLQKGRIVIEGAGRVEELERFRPFVEIADALGVHRVPIAADGTFEFQSFEGQYDAAIKDLPLGYRSSVAISGSSVEVKLRVLQGDDFGLFRLLQPR